MLCRVGALLGRLFCAVKVIVVAVDDDGMLTVPVVPASAGSGAAVGVVPMATVLLAELTVGDGEGEGFTTGAVELPPPEHAARVPSAKIAVRIPSEALICIPFLRSTFAGSSGPACLLRSQNSSGPDRELNVSMNS